MLVVGAGPAGLSAARALALAGADVIVADERLHPGGQYFKPLAPSHQADPSTLDRQFRDGAILRQSALLAGVRILSEATVWAAFSPHEVAAIVAGRSTLFRPKRLVLATGAYEQSLPVPGWTLPGVLTVGGLQTLARSYRVAPGQRIVVAGNGPLCLQTAAELLDGGANVVAVLEAASRPGLARWRDLLAAASAEPGLLIEGLGLANRLRGLLHWNRKVTRLVGEGRVQRVEAGDLSIDADIVALGYGFASSSELARALGCAHRFVPRGSGSMETLTNAEGRTSIGEVFAIGDGARFGGAHAARAQGIVAAAAIAADLGLKVPQPTAARRTLGRSARFQAALWRLFEAPPFDPDAIDDSAIVCRCEEVTAGELRQQIAAGYDTPAGLKRKCRVGMGRCQGRYCAAVVARMTIGRRRRIRPVRAAPAGQAGAHPCALGRTGGMERPQGFRAARHGAAARDGAVAGGNGRHAGDRRRRRRLLPRLLAGARGHRDAGGRARRGEPAGFRRQCGHRCTSSSWRSTLPWGHRPPIAPPIRCRLARPRWRCGRRSSATPARTSR